MISVIIPVYNVEKYLKACIESVCAQTFRDLEIILVDDGSTDSSGEICDEFAKKDSRIVVIHKTNGGATSARKAGAEVSSGDEIICIDSDDWIDSTYIEQLTVAKNKTNVELVISNVYYTIGDTVSMQKNACLPGIYHSFEIWNEMLFKPPFFSYGILPHMVNKLFSREIFCKCIQEIDERIVQGEDAALTYNCLLHDITVCVSDICGYHYIQRGTSIRARYRDDEYERCSLLFEYLEELNTRYHAEMTQQIKQFKKCFMLLRCPSELEINKLGHVLSPYGGIPTKSRIILYGAGYMGSALYSYLMADSEVEIVLWADRNFATYQKWGLPVDCPMRIPEISGKYDFIIIAVMNEEISNVIRHDLMSLGVPSDMIRWLSPEFLES